MYGYPQCSTRRLSEVVPGVASAILYGLRGPGEPVNHCPRRAGQPRHLSTLEPPNAVDYANVHP